MAKGLLKRFISALLIVCALLGLFPTSTFASLRTGGAGPTRAAADLTSAINALTSPIKQTNTLLNNLTVSNTGLLAGTYYIVNKDASGQNRVFDPFGSAANGNLKATPVTVSNNSVSGADISMAIDLVWDASNTYYFAASDGRYLVEYAYSGNPYVVLCEEKSLPFGINFYNNTSYQAHSVRIYRNFGGAVRDMRYNGSGEFGWTNNVPGSYPITHQFVLYKIAQRWDTSELYNAIQTMKSYAAANNGKYAAGIHDAFMDCMEKSIALYKKHNVATSNQTYDQIVAIRSELKAQAQWLLSYKDVLQASYADAAASIPTPRNTYVPVSWGDLTINKMALLNGKTYFIVNKNADGTSGHLVDLSQSYYAEDLMVAQSVTIEDGQILNADPNWGIYFDTSENVYCTILKPVHGLCVGVEYTEEGSDYHKIVYYSTSRDFEINPFSDGLYINVHPGGKDVDDDGRNDRYALNYIESENGFRLMLDLNETQTATNTMHLYQLSTQSIELYKAIIRLAPYATGNADERYPATTYTDFITCLTDSIQLYQQYNVVLNTTDEANLATIQSDMDEKAEELRTYLSTLTRQDTITEFIDIPVEIYDFRADGLLFEYLNQHYNLASVSPGSSLKIPGDWSNHGRINLTDLTLTNRQITYTEEVVTFVAESMYEEGALSNVGEEGFAPGWNDVFYNMLPTVSDTPLEKGDYDTTIKNTSTGKNGGELRWSQVKTYYDLAYYILTYLWRPVNPADIIDTENNLPYNVTIEDRDRLRLYADEKGNYLLDAANDIVYDGYYVYNPTPRASEDITYDSPLFTPADGLGFETPEMLTALGGDTDRGDLYASNGFETAATNFHFAMHAYGSFVYYEDQNQYFEFVGDDDVYFFINGQMALDLGGAHQALGDRVELNDIAAKLGLEDDTVYDFDMFYAERHTSASNLKFSTNIKIVDTDTITTMGQYAQTYNGSSKVDPATGLGQEIIDNGAVYVGDTTAYSFDLTNSRDVPVYDISFVCPSLGANISSNALNLYKPALTNGAETKITDITVYYRTVTQNENDDDIIDASTPLLTSYSDMEFKLNAAISANTELDAGSYRVPISSESELIALLKLGIPYNCQISVYGFKRNTTQNDTPFTNTVTSQCYYTRVATNEGSAGGEVFTLNGIASRKLRVSANLPSIDPQQIVLDYGKKVNIPVSQIAEEIYTDSFVTVSGLAGITLSGNHEEVLKNAPSGLACTTSGSSYTTAAGVFTRTDNGLEYRLSDFFDTVETVNLVYSLKGCELTDPDGAVTEYKYILVQLQLIPATSVYYETNFTDGVFDLSENPGYLLFDFGNTYEDQLRYQGDDYGFYNFDTEENGYWATRGTSSTTNIFNGYTIDNDAGTLTLKVANGRAINDTIHYGPWLSTTSRHAYNPSAVSNSNMALDFDPSRAEVVQLCFKVTDCEVTTSTDPRVVVVYDHTTNGVTKRGAYDMVASYSHVDGQYIIVSMPTTDEFKNADSIRSFGFRFWDLKTSNNGNIMIDYIYVGPQANLPDCRTKQGLFFDFKNKPADAARYASAAYGNLNFDLKENWSRTGSFKPVEIDTSGIGTLSTQLTDTTSETWHYIHTGAYTTTKPLNYTPGSDDVFQVRLRIDNAASSEESGVFRFGFYYRIDDETKDRFGYNDFKLEDYNNKGYFIYTHSMRSYSHYVGAQQVKTITPYLNFVQSSDAGAAKITIDYIYLGPREDAPTYEPFFIDFTNTEVDQQRYASQAYNYTNYDDPTNWILDSSFKQTSTVNGLEDGTLNLELVDNYSSNGWHQIRTQTDLNYIPNKTDVFEMRLKIEDSSLIDTNSEKAGAIRVGFGFTTDIETTTRYRYGNYLFEDYANVGYITYTYAMSSNSYYNAASRITSIRPYIHFLGSSESAAAKITIDYFYLGPSDGLEKVRAEKDGVWHTVSDSSTPDAYQDVDMVVESTASAVATSYVSESSAVSEVTPATKSASAVTRAASSLDLPDGVTISSTKEYTIADGVTETNITVNDKKLAIYVANIDASSKTTLKVSTPGYYTTGSTEESRVANFYSMQNDIAYTTNQAAAYEAATGETILFAMNGSFFDGDEVNRGPLVLEGNVLQAWFGTLRSEPMFAMMKDGSYAILDFTDDFSNVEEAIGARHRLVKNGVNVIDGVAEDSNLIYTLHPRTAIGLKADGSVVCIVVDGRTQAGYTTGGINLPDLADLMISLGCVDAVNLDGGGSSTFVTRRTPTGNLAMRNISSEAAGQRTVASALMFISTEDHCQHVYENNDYRMLSEGRHELLCDVCRDGIDSPHRYQNGKCICGKQEEVSPNLFFDFANTPADRERYNNAAYGYHNFDTPTNATWWRGLWATQSTDSDSHPRYDFEIYNESGIMRVDVADTTGNENVAEANRTDKPYGETWNYGPYIVTTSVFYQWPGLGDEKSLALNYDPSQAEIAQIRFKLEGCSAKTTTPSVVLWGNCTKNGANASAPQLGASYTFVEDEYIVVDIPLDNAFRTCGTIRSLGLRFKDIYSDAVESDNGYGDRGDQGTVAIDYIYVGTKADAPTYGELFIDFTNTKADQARYATHTFSGLNLDLAENWTEMGNYYPPVVSDGVMTMKRKYETAVNGYVTTGKTLESRPLNYIPSADDYLQIRFKIDEAVSTAASGLGRFVLFYADPSNTTVPGNHHYVAYNFPTSDVVDKGWFTMTFKIADMETNGTNFTQYDTIGSISPGFYWLTSAEGELASFQIDYIYIGSEEGLPSFDQPTYGYDSSYNNDAKLSDGSSLFVNGLGIPKLNSDYSINHAATSAYSESSFTFTGTGFDIISRTGANQGLIRVMVFDANGKHVKTAQVLNRSENALELYQIPVLSIEGLSHGSYTVKIYIADAYDYGNDGNADKFGGSLDRGGEFYFDAVRIYNPINTTASTADAQIAYDIYQSHGEADAVITEVRNMLITAGNFNAGGNMEGVVYLDAKTDSNKTALANYREVGPNNEVYLAAGKAIAFKLEVTGTLPASVDIGAKSANGTSVSMIMSVSGNAPTAKPSGNAKNLTSSTSQYYPLNILPSEWKTDSGKNYVYVTVYNSGTSGILSITDIKYAYDVPKVSSTSEEANVKRSVRFLIDLEMLEALSVCAEHDYRYGNNGEDHTAVCTICSYSITEVHTYGNGICICGATQSTEPSTDENLKFNMAITVGAEMNVGYTFMAEPLAKYESFYLEVSKNVAGGEPIVTIFNVDELKAITNPSTGEALMYNASYTGINAKEMGDAFTATLYAVDENGKVYCGPTQTASIKSYLIQKMSAADATLAFKTMAVDMLGYGAAAQVRLNYDTGNLVTADLTEEQLSYATKDVPEAADCSATNGSGVDINTSVLVATRVELGLSCIYSNAADPSAVKCVITDTEGNVLAELATQNIAGVMYSAIYDNVGAKQMRQPIMATFYDGETAISRTLTWSVESYVAQTRAKENVTEAEVNMVNAMLAYGDSVAMHLKASGQ